MAAASGVPSRAFPQNLRATSLRRYGDPSAALYYPSLNRTDLPIELSLCGDEKPWQSSVWIPTSALWLAEQQKKIEPPLQRLQRYRTVAFYSIDQRWVDQLYKWAYEYSWLNDAGFREAEEQRRLQNAARNNASCVVVARQETPSKCCVQ